VVWIDEQAASGPGGAESFTEHVPVIPFDASGLDDYMGALEDAATLEAWDALDRDFETMFAEKGFDDSLARQAWLLGRQSAFAKAYFEAYFRGGRFLEARLDGSQLLDKVRADLQEQLEGIGDPELRDTLVLQELTRLVGLFAPSADPDRVREIVEEVWSGNYTSIDELLTLGKIRDEGFVTRSGTKYQFPAISVEIDPLRDEPLQVTQVDFKAVGNELVVVLVEAMFDGLLATPCVDEATGAGLPDGLRLPRFVDDDAGVTADQFRSVDSNAQRLGGLAGASIGRLVRGLGWISLDNEALAGLVESLFATVVQKSVEKVLWCYFRCEVAGAGLWDTGLEHAWGDGVQRVRISLTGLTHEP
jgi:hypothetical protein